MKKRIKYFTYHACLDNGRLRCGSPAADTKVDYIVSVLNRIGYGVDIISLAPSSESYYLSPLLSVKGDNIYRYFGSLGLNKSLFRIINRWIIKIQFLFWSLFNLKRHEQVIVYHSLGYCRLFLLLKKLKQIHIIGEIEEIYQDVSVQNAKKCHNEYRFIELCDKYIFPTQLLNNKLNKLAKSYVIVHGVYAESSIVEDKFTDGKVHVVYGGTLDPNKGGAYAAVESATHLSSKFHIHICGFGDSIAIKNLIKSLQSKTKATITFEGELIGEDYVLFIQKCHIGLSTQNPNAKFNDTSFPSKILVYLSNGLKVVSARIPVVVNSALVNNMYFYDKQTPKEIAESIVCASNAKLLQNNILYDLDKRFEIELNNLIKA